MAKITVRLNRNGFRQVARSDEVRAELERRAGKVAEAARRDAPEGQEVDVSAVLGRNRARASVMAPKGLESDRETGWLSRAIDAARE